MNPTPQAAVSSTVGRLVGQQPRDIVDQLRDSQPTGTKGGLLLNDAADEIEKLRKIVNARKETCGECVLFNMKRSSTVCQRCNRNWDFVDHWMPNTCTCDTRPKG